MIMRHVKEVSPPEMGVIAVGIVAHTQRELRHDALRQAVEPEVFSLDDGSLKCEQNHLTVLRRLLGPADQWAVVLEDDAEPCDDFRNVALRALQHAHAPIVGLYLGTGNPSGETQHRIREAVIASQAWIVANCLIGAVGYAVRTEILADLIEGIKDREEELPMRITRWAQDRGVEVCYTQPSLVNHEDSDPIGHTYRSPSYLPRKAWNWQRRVVPEKWDTPAVRLGYCPVWSGAKEA